MRGSVRELHALIPVTFRLPTEPSLIIEFVIDTGFTGFLTLPPAAVTAMSLPLLHLTPADLADGTTVNLPVHSATIEWHGSEREVRVLAAGPRPLLGTALLEGSELLIQFADGGSVAIEVL